MARVIVFGASGLLGAHVYRKLIQCRTFVVGTCSTKTPVSSLIPLDLTISSSVRQVLHDVQPDAVIWCVKAHEGRAEVQLMDGGLAAVLRVQSL